MITFSSIDHFYVTVLTGFIKRVHSFQPNRQKDPWHWKVGNRLFSFYALTFELSFNKCERDDKGKLISPCLYSKCWIPANLESLQHTHNFVW